MSSFLVWFFIGGAVFWVAHSYLVRRMTDRVWMQAKDAVSATVPLEEGETAPILEAKINRRSMSWDVVPIFGVTICEVSDGCVYRERMKDNLIEDRNGLLVISRRFRWRYWSYDFRDDEPGMTRTKSNPRSPSIFESGDWRDELSSEEGETGGIYVCGRFQFSYDDKTKTVAFQIVDPAWRLRQIAIGYFILNRCSPEPGD